MIIFYIVVKYNVTCMNNIILYNIIMSIMINNKNIHIPSLNNSTFIIKLQKNIKPPMIKLNEFFNLLSL